MGRIRERRARGWVRIGASDKSLTRFSGMAGVSELVDRLGMITRLDAAIGPIKVRDRGLSGGQTLVGIAAARLAGQDFLVGLHRQRADAAGPGAGFGVHDRGRAGAAVQPGAVGGDRDRAG